MNITTVQNYRDFVLPDLSKVSSVLVVGDSVFRDFMATLIENQYGTPKRGEEVLVYGDLQVAYYPPSHQAHRGYHCEMIFCKVSRRFFREAVKPLVHPECTCFDFKTSFYFTTSETEKGVLSRSVVFELGVYIDPNLYAKKYETKHGQMVIFNPLGEAYPYPFSIMLSDKGRCSIMGEIQEKSDFRRIFEFMQEKILPGIVNAGLPVFFPEL